MSGKIDAIKSFTEMGLFRLRGVVKDLKEEQMDWKYCPQANTIRWILTHLASELHVFIPKILTGDKEYKPDGWPDDYIGNQSYSLEKILGDIEKGEETLMKKLDGLGEEVLSEEYQAQKLAERLGIEYIDLHNFQIDHDLFRAIPVDLMFRYNFVPYRREDSRLIIVVADPTDVLMIDELELLLGTDIEVCVGTQSAIQDILKKSESSQRILEEATEEFKIQILQEDEEGEEALSIDKITSDSSPIIKLVDSTIFNAIQRRASDIHVETREREVVIKYRIDGVL